jgi:hypothetical protein
VAGVTEGGETMGALDREIDRLVRQTAREWGIDLRTCPGGRCRACTGGCRRTPAGRPGSP